ncbi:type IV secretion system protein [Sphingomonas sp. MMS24-JH45]
MLVVTGAGPWIAARLVLALLLAIGPLAIVAALFEMSIGFTIGWFRALVGAALATLVSCSACRSNCRCWSAPSPLR